MRLKWAKENHCMWTTRWKWYSIMNQESVLIYNFIDPYTHTHTHTHIHRHTEQHINTRTLMHTYTHIHMYKHKHTYRHIHMYNLRHTHTQIYLQEYLRIHVQVKLSTFSRGRLEGSLFNSYYTEVVGRALLLSQDCSTLPWYVPYNAEC